MSVPCWHNGGNTDLRMNRTLSAFLLLLRSGLWQQTVDDTALFPLSAQEWGQLYAEARRQTVTGWIYRGICLLPEEWMPPQQLMFRWVADIDRIEQRSRMMNRTLLQLTSLLEENGFRAVVQKGQGVAAFYSEPLWRECGDIDLFFPNADDRRGAEAWLRERGIVPELKPDGSTAYRWMLVEVEHHADLFDLQSPKAKNILDELMQEKGFSTMSLAAEGDISVPAPELNLLLLNTHILKHAMGKGIGLRQLCDMARAYAVLGEKVDGEELRNVYQTVGIEKWSRLLHTFLVDVLAMPEDFLPYREDKKETAVPLWNIVLRGGNFGQYSQQQKTNTERTWLRKWNTCRAFLLNARFSLKYAPSEAIHTFGQLVWGNFGGSCAATK